MLDAPNSAVGALVPLGFEMYSCGDNILPPLASEALPEVLSAIEGPLRPTVSLRLNRPALSIDTRSGARRAAHPSKFTAVQETRMIITTKKMPPNFEAH